MLLAGLVLPLLSPDHADDGTTTSAAGVVAGAPSAAADPAAPGVGESTATVPGGAEATSGTPGASGSDAGPAADSQVRRTASDQGVTAGTIKLGIALSNLDTLSRTGVGASNGTVAERNRIWQVLVDDANAKGGAAGRKIELAAGDFDPLDSNTSLELCRQLAEDSKVFAVVTDPGWPAQPSLCLTRQYGIPTIVYDSQDTATFGAAKGLLWTTKSNNDSLAYSHVRILHDRGLLKDKKIGLVEDDGLSAATDRTLIPTLRSLGYELTHRSKLSRDTATAQSQIPLEIQQMRSKGVNLVLFDGDPLYANIWLNQAQRAGYNPKYSIDDLGQSTDDFSLQAVTEQVDAIGWGLRRKLERRGDAPEAPSDVACITRLRQATGMSIPRSGDLYFEATRYCAVLSVFVAAANRAGPNPTRQTYAGAMSSIGRRGDLDIGPSGQGGSWTPGKPDAVDFIHELRADQGCRCWKPVGNWFPMPRAR
jgi:ABC-type branched-subunit amino acid transport system substrate-binding protein